MRKTKVFVCLFMCIVLVLLFGACSGADPAPKSRISFMYFDTVSTLYDYSGMSDARFDKLADEFEEQLRGYHELYDIYNEYDGVTNIASLNRLAGKGAQKVDKRIVDMLLFAKEMYTLTSGNVNVAMGAVLGIWHDYREAGVEIPSVGVLNEAAKHTDIDDLIIDAENLTVELRDPEMSLDVGAIAKGYAAEMLAADFDARGYTSLILDIGGNIRAVGAKPSGAGWSMGVQDPDDMSSTVYKTEIKNCAAVTSGDYQRYYTVGGVRYHHIINGVTLYPEHYYRSVTVIADSSALADALSTAIFNMEYVDARSFVLSLNGVSAVLVHSDGRVECINGDAR